MKVFTWAVSLFLGLLQLSACGLLSSNGGASRLNEPVPEGIAEASGTIQGRNGTQMAGSVVILRVDGGSSRTIRLEGLTTDFRGSVYMTLESGGQVAFQSILRASAGNQNYPTGLSQTQSWTSVTFRNGQDAINSLILGQALLTPLQQNPPVIPQ
jgi:hypothetical protein